MGTGRGDFGSGTVCLGAGNERNGFSSGFVAIGIEFGNFGTGKMGLGTGAEGICFGS
jgi:hypothetical protein